MGNPDPPHGVGGAFSADKFKGKGGTMSAAQGWSWAPGLCCTSISKVLRAASSHISLAQAPRVASTARHEGRAVAEAALSVFTRTTIPAKLVGTRCLMATRRLTAYSSWMAGNAAMNVVV